MAAILFSKPYEHRVSYPLVNIQKAIENGDLYLIYPFNMVDLCIVMLVRLPGRVYPDRSSPGF